MSSVSIQQLQRCAGEVIGLAQAGEVVEVTEHGIPVALIVPLSNRVTPLENQVSEAIATTAKGSLSDLPPPLTSRSGKLPSAALADLREEER